MGPITDELLAQLQEFRSRYAAPMLKVQTTLAEDLRLEATARLKTVNTTVEKLRRDKTRLSQIQDIGGVRLVGDWTLDGQDPAELRKRIAQLDLPELERRESVMADRVRKMLTVMTEHLDAMLIDGSTE